MVDTTEQTELMSREEIEGWKTWLDRHPQELGGNTWERSRMYCLIDTALRAHDIRDEALEEAAKTCDQYASDYQEMEKYATSESRKDSCGSQALAANRLADNIRSLKGRT